MMYNYGPNRGARDKERGVTLLETLLAVGLSAILATFLVNTMQNWAEIEKASAASSYMGTMSGAIGEMTQTYEQFDTLFKQAELAGGTVQIGILDSEGFPISLQSGAWSGSDQILPGSSQITQSYVNMSPLKEGFSVVVSATRLGPTAGERALKIVLASRQLVPENEARETAAKLGAGGGIISVRSVSPSTECLPVGCSRTLRSIFNDWTLDLADFNGTAWSTTVQATPPSTSGGAYIVFYRYLTADESAGDYLYRVPVDGSPEINRMNVDLNMSGNSIIGVDNVRLNNLNVVDYASVQGSVSVTGAFDTHQLTVNGDARVGSIDMARTYAADPRLDEVYGGRVVNTVTVDGAVNAPAVSGSNLNAARVRARILDVPEILAGTLEQQGVIVTQTLTAQSVTADSIQANDILIGGTLVVNNLTTFPSVTVNSADVVSFSASNLTANVSAGSTSIGLLTACSGCY